jgi:predicted metalloprotease
MKWEGRERSTNVEDRRGIGPGKLAAGGGSIGLIILFLLYVITGDKEGADKLLQQVPSQVQQQQQPGGGQKPAPDDKTREFIEVVLKSTEDVWNNQFPKHVGGNYEPPRLIIYSGQTNSGCGIAQSQMGPFYCPADRKVYIDPSFFEDLAKRHKAPGDFAQAYVIAHEVAHHIQTLLGLTAQVENVRRSGSKIEGNRASVRLELQADYLAGVWAHHAHRQYEILEPGDIKEAINAARQIGDDTLMKEATGYADPRHFTHGTSEQRMRWFSEGLKSGDFMGLKALFDMDYEDLVP